MSNIDLNELYQGLHRINRQMHRMAHRDNYKKGGIYHGQAHLLVAVLNHDGASQRDLAEQLDVRPSSMTEMLTKLEKNNLIVRKQDEKDQRVMHIHLTEEGKKSAEEILESKDHSAASFFQALSEEEQEQLMLLVKKLSAGLEAEDDCHESRHYGHGFGHHGSHHHHGQCDGDGLHHNCKHHGRDDRW